MYFMARIADVVTIVTVTDATTVCWCLYFVVNRIVDLFALKALCVSNTSVASGL